jgi:hypothetical protein
MKSGDFAQAVGKGLVAGDAGTVAVTASRLLAQLLLGDEMPTAAAEAAEKLVGVEPADQGSEQRLGTITHFLYGSVWGIARAVMELVGLRAWRATAAHLGAVEASAETILPALDLGPPPSRVPPKDIAMNTVHHGIYAITTAGALRFLDRHSERANLSAA